VVSERAAIEYYSRIAFLAVPGLSDDAEKVRQNGMHHYAFEYGSFANLMSSFDRLRAAGVLPSFCLDHGLTISLYYKPLQRRGTQHSRLLGSSGSQARAPSPHFEAAAQRPSTARCDGT
jgi:hypothetical protein